MDRAIDTAVHGLLRSWRLRIWIGVQLLLVLILALAAPPLFGVLGYELALSSAILASLAGLDLGAALARRAAKVATAEPIARPFTVDGAPARRVLALVWRAAALAAVVTAIPALAAALNGLRVPTCDWGFGIRAYLSMATASAVLGAGAGVVIGLAAGRRTWLGVVGWVGLVLALAFAGLWRFYSEPAVFSYSPLLGYFPGNLYDENVELGWPLYLARLEQLLWVVAALAGTMTLLDGPSLRILIRDRRPGGWRWPPLIVAAIALAGASVMSASSGRLGYAVDAEDIQAELGGRVESEHFVIYYSSSASPPVDAALLAEDHELRLAQVAEALEMSADDLRRLGKIHSYNFASRDQKARLMGARDVEMAKPWRREIYLTTESFPHPSLRHEIAHVVAGAFGSPWFRVSARRILGLPLLVNPGLVEGLAVAVDWPGYYGRALTPHQSVRAMQRMGIEPGLGELMSIGFLSLSSARGYTTAGSFVRFLLDRHGAAPLKRLYASGGDFRAAYGRGIGELEAEWRAMLETVPLSDAEVEVVRERFRRGGVFSRPCPHAIAARREEAAIAAGRGDRPGAVRALRDVCRDAPEEPRYRLDLADALVGGAEGERAEAVAIYQDVVGDLERMTSSLRGDALEALAQIAVAARDWPGAERQLAEARALPLEDGPARQLEAKLFALRHRGAAGPALRAYFFGADAGTEADASAALVAGPIEDPLGWATVATVAEPALGLGWYLRGLQRAGRSDHAGAAADLALALRLTLPSTRFVRNAARMLAVSAWRTGDRAAVAAAASVLEGAAMSEMDRLLAADWRWKLAWVSAHASSSTSR